MAHTDKMSVLGPAVEAYIESGREQLGLRKVWYGDDESIPETPAVLITPGDKRRTLTNTGHTTLNTFRITLTLFHSRFTDPRITRGECDEMAETLEAWMHANKRLGGLLLHSHVESIEFGQAVRGNVIMKATQLQWTAQSQTRI